MAETRDWVSGWFPSLHSCYSTASLVSHWICPGRDAPRVEAEPAGVFSRLEDDERLSESR